MNAKTQVLTMGIVGMLLAIGIIGGVNTFQRNFLGAPRSNNSSLSSGSSSLTSESSQGPGTGVLAVQLTDPPNVPNGVTRVFINYSEIDVHIAGVGQSSGWYTVANSSVIDLMGLVNVSMTIGNAPVSSGVFNLVRFDINSAVITFQGKNYSARVPSNHLTIPIISGGIKVAANGSAGLLIDVSPTVVPLINKSVPSFILVPAAKSFPIPRQLWNPILLQTGERDDRRWWSAFEQYTTGNVIITSAGLSPNLLRVVVKNTGNASVYLTGIAISANITIGPMVSAVATSSSSSQGIISGVVGAVVNNSVTLQENIATILGNQSYYERLRTIATFAILMNGTLVQEAEVIHLPLAYLGFVLSPGETRSFVFNSTIETFSSMDNMSAMVIVPGIQYTISVLGGFETQAFVNVNAT